MEKLKRKPVVGYNSKIEVIKHIINQGIDKGCSAGSSRKDDQGNVCHCKQAYKPWD